MGSAGDFGDDIGKVFLGWCNNNSDPVISMGCLIDPTTNQLLPNIPPIRSNGHSTGRPTIRLRCRRVPDGEWTEMNFVIMEGGGVTREGSLGNAHCLQLGVIGYKMNEYWTQGKGTREKQMAEEEAREHNLPPPTDGNVYIGPRG